TQTLAKLEATEIRRYRGSAVDSLLKHPEAAAWLEGLSTEEILLMGKRFFPTQIDPESQFHLLTSQPVLAAAASHGQLPPLLDAIQELLNVDIPTTQNLIDLCFRRPVQDRLLRVGQHQFLLQLIKAHPERVSPSALVRLVASPVFLGRMLAEGDPSDLVSFAKRLPTPEHTGRVFSYLLQDARWRSTLMRSGQLRVIRGWIESQPLSMVTANLWSTLATYPAQQAHVSDDQLLELFTWLTSRETDKPPALSTLLLSPHVAARMAEIGRTSWLDRIALEAGCLSYFGSQAARDRLSESQIAQLKADFEGSIQASRFSVDHTRLLPWYIKENGHAMYLQLFHERDRSDTRLRLARSSDVLGQVFQRGELPELLAELPNSSHRLAVYGLRSWIRRRDGVKYTYDAKFPDHLIEFLSKLKPPSRDIGSLVSNQAVALAFYRANKEDQYWALRKRAVASRIPSNQQQRESDRSMVLAGRGHELLARQRQKQGDDHTVSEFVSLVISSGLHGQELERIKSLSEDQRTHWHELCHVTLLRALGKHAQAKSEAIEYGMEAYAAAIAVEQYDWGGAFTMQTPVQRELPGGPSRQAIAEDAEVIAMRGRLAAFATDAKRYQSSVARLRELAKEHADTQSVANYIAEGLILMQDIPSGLATFRQSSWRQFRMQVHRGYYDPALAFIAWGRKPALEYFDAASSGQPAESRRRIEAMKLMLDIADLQRTVGRHQQADAVCSALKQYRDKTVERGERHSRFDQALLTASVRGMDAQQLDAPVLDPLVQNVVAGSASLPNADPFELRHHSVWGSMLQARVNDPKLSVAAHAIYQMLETQFPELTPVRRLAIVGRILDDQATKDDMLKLIEAADVAVQGNNGLGNASHSLSGLVDLWASRQLSFPWKDPSATDAVFLQANSPYTLYQGAIDSFRRKNYRSAAARFQKAFELQPERVDLQCMQAESERRALGPPDLKNAERRRAEALAKIYLHDDRVRLANTFADAGLHDFAEQQWLIIRNTLFPGDPRYLNATRQLFALADTTLQRVRYSRHVLLWSLIRRENRRDEIRMLDDLLELQHQLMTLGLERKDPKLIRYHASLARRINPNDATWTSEFIGRLDRANLNEVADELFQRASDFFDSRIAKFTNSAELRLRRAELCVACGRELEEAKQDLSEAVKLSPDVAQRAEAISLRLSRLPR
ncbi:MAG: hypothetical protein AAGA03_05665, partial [Planctomycetota bacterium]